METHTCKGFKFAGIASGIKKKGGRDLGLIYSEVPATVAGVFTRNKVKAAPVVLDCERIQSGVCRAILVNSGNANCCTGQEGMNHAIRMAQCASDALSIDETHVLVASTGVIGQPLPIEKIESAMPELLRSLDEQGISMFVESIMTTDTLPKLSYRKGTIDDKPFSVIGVAKGSGMICPDMATMLCFVCTDAAVNSDRLQAMLSDATRNSFNRITVDGDTSTNDTALLLANGVSNVSIQRPEDVKIFQDMLNEVMLDLARMIIIDGEGATKFVEIRAEGALTDADARSIADAVANSNLVKTALFGEDANWGRILAAAGRAHVPIDPDKTDIYFDKVCMVKNGIGCGLEAERDASQVLKQKKFVISLKLNLGQGSASVLTCDFSLDYVKINADYRS